MNSDGLTKRLIPSLLLKEGRLVKGTSFLDWQDAGRAETTVRAHNAQGADEIMLLDIEASRQQRLPDFASIVKVAAECFMPLTVGGGIRSLEIAKQCFAAGADKILLTTSALDNPELITELAETFGRQAIVLGVDIISDGADWKLYNFCKIAAVQHISWQQWISEGVGRGAGELRLMSVDHEGKRAGMNVDLLRVVRELVDIPLIFEGGAGTHDHLAEGLHNGADAVAAGAMLVFADNNLVKVKRYLAAKELNMRVQ